MMPGVEEMAFLVHEKDHRKFEEVSKRLSDITGQKYTLFYSWCKECRDIIQKEKKQ